MNILNKIRLAYHRYKINQIYKRVISNSISMTKCSEELARESGKTWEYASQIEKHNQAIKKIKSKIFYSNT